MQCITPSNLPLKPPLTVSIYKTLPDASNADLPPKPLVTPMGLSPSRFHFPRAALVPSSKETPLGQKRKYSCFNDSVVVPSQYNQAQDGIKHAPYDSPSTAYNGVKEGKPGERHAKHRRMTPSRTGTYSYNGSNNDTTGRHYQPPLGDTPQQQLSNKTRSGIVQMRLRIIHDALLGGARALPKGDQDYLLSQLQDPACIRALMWLVAKQVTNKTYNLFYGIIHWAHNHSELDIMEYMLEDRLYSFDKEEAFDEGLMKTQEVIELMDCQMVLGAVRKQLMERQKKAQKETAQHPNTNAGFDAGNCESEAGSADMDFSEEDQ